MRIIAAAIYARTSDLLTDEARLRRRLEGLGKEGA